jgi:hypothetical protein
MRSRIFYRNCLPIVAGTTRTTEAPSGSVRGGARNLVKSARVDLASDLLGPSPACEARLSYQLLNFVEAIISHGGRWTSDPAHRGSPVLAGLGGQQSADGLPLAALAPDCQ